MTDTATLASLYARACKWRGGRDFFVDERHRASGVAAIFGPGTPVPRAAREVLAASRGRHA